MKRPLPLLAAAALLAVASFVPPASAQLRDSLRNLGGGSTSGSGSGTAAQGGGLGGLLGGDSGGGAALPSFGASQSGNVAGVLEYCVKNNYLNANSASSVKDQLAQKAGISTGSNDGDYAQGQKGILSGSNGQSFDLNSIKGQIAKAACDKILSQAGSLL